jgi:hypothetical protein
VFKWDSGNYNKSFMFEVALRVIYKSILWETLTLVQDAGRHCNIKYSVLYSTLHD